jgi:tetratricopeptide (TPR) repeat protein
MDGLIRIIKILKPAEIKFIEKFYGAKEQKTYSKRLLLFRLISEGKVKSNKEAAALIYRHSGGSKLSQLKKRLKEDILNVMLLMPAEKVYASPFAKAELMCRKLLIQGKFLLTRGDYEDALGILKKVSQTAGRFELHDVKLAVDDLLRTHLGIKLGIKAYLQYTNQIESHLEALQELLYAKEYSHLMMIPHLFEANKEKEQGFSGQQGLARLQAGFEKTRSNWVGFWYYLAAIHYCCSRKEYQQAHTYALELKELIERQPAICSIPNQAGVCLELARILIHLKKYDEATAHAAMAVSKFSPGMLNELQALEVLYYAHFRNQNYQDASQVTDRAIRHQQIRSNQFFQGKWFFLEANRLFAEGRHTESLRTLQTNAQLRKDKSGWSLGYKLLEMLNLLELKEYDWFDFNLESFRKLLQQEVGQNPDRCKSIYQIFKSLLKTNFHFPSTLQQESGNMSLLTDATGSYYWDPMGYEVIKVDVWLAGKA